MNILYPLHITDFDTLLDGAKKEADTEGEEMIHIILYLENSDNVRFSVLNERF